MFFYAVNGVFRRTFPFRWLLLAIIARKGLVFCTSCAILLITVDEKHLSGGLKITLQADRFCNKSAKLLRNSVRYQHPELFPGVDTAIPQCSFIDTEHTLACWSIQQSCCFSGKHLYSGVFTFKLLPRCRIFYGLKNSTK